MITTVTDPAELRLVHARLLAPTFSPDELLGAEELSRAVAGDSAEVLVLRRADEPTSVAVAEFFPAASVVLLSYLATAPAVRSTGQGRQLLDAALARWTARHDPCLVLAEVEDPAHHPRNRYGDPEARLRFYARGGAEVLDLPYFQPRLRPDSARVPHLFLLVLHSAPSLRSGPGAVDGTLVRRFLEELFVGGEGRLPEDPDGRRLLAAATGGVRVGPLHTA
ncbi:hypothetical protein ACI78V_03975 [Geodermatophilus sp. SYSU D00742]